MGRRPMRLCTSIASLILASLGWSQTYSIHTIAGASLPDNISATSVRLGYVFGLALDDAGDVIFAAASAGEFAQAATPV